MTSRTAWREFAGVDLAALHGPELYVVPYKVSNGPKRRGTLRLRATDEHDALRRAQVAYEGNYGAMERKRFNATMAWGRPVLARDYRGGE